MPTWTVEILHSIDARFEDQLKIAVSGSTMLGLAKRGLQQWCFCTKLVRNRDAKNKADHATD